MNERKTKTKNKHKVKESLCLGGRISSPLLLFSIRQLRGHHLSSSVDRQLLCLPCISFYFPQLADTLPNTKRNRKKVKKKHTCSVYICSLFKRERTFQPKETLEALALKNVIQFGVVHFPAAAKVPALKTNREKRPCFS